MDDTEGDGPVPDGKWVRERRPADHLDSDESVQYVLTNRAVGVHREGNEETVELPPGEDYGALAIATDRRVLVLVGDCPERDGDVVMPIPHEVVTDASVETETLTERLVIETGSDVAWAFTAREVGETGDVAAFIDAASAAWRTVEANMEAVETARDRLEAVVGTDDRSAREEALDAAREALVPIEDALADVTVPALEARVEATVAEVDELAAVHLRREADVLADAAEDRLADYEYEDGYDRLREAEEHLDRATSLVDDDAESVAAADGGATVAATETRLDDIRAALGTRPLDDAAAHRQRAAEAEATGDRIDALEEALRCYRNAAALVGAPDTPFEGDERAAREDAVAVIDDLVTARIEAGESANAGGEWERAAGNPRSAYELFNEAREHFEEALELAESYPPGDAGAIRATLEDVATALDSLAIAVELDAVDDADDTDDE